MTRASFSFFIASVISIHILHTKDDLCDVLYVRKELISIHILHTKDDNSLSKS